jgi:hypothetical protein
MHRGEMRNPYKIVVKTASREEAISRTEAK